MTTTIYAGTVCDVINKHIHEVDFDAPLTSIKQQVISILSSDEIKKKDDAKKFIAHIQRLNNKSALISTVGTYMTCIKCK